jgi:hypothetical protein
MNLGGVPVRHMIKDVLTLRFWTRFDAKSKFELPSKSTQ